MAKKTDFARLNSMAAGMTANKPLGAAHSNDVIQSNSAAFNRDASNSQARHAERDQQVAANHSKLMSELGANNND